MLNCWLDKFFSIQPRPQLDLDKKITLQIKFKGIRRYRFSFEEFSSKFLQLMILNGAVNIFPFLFIIGFLPVFIFRSKVMCHDDPGEQNQGSGNDEHGDTAPPHKGGLQKTWNATT